MSYIAKQKDGYKDVIMRMANDDKCKIPNGEYVSVLGEAGENSYNVKWQGFTGTVKKENLVAAKPESVITANPNKRFDEVFLWKDSEKTPVPNGTTLTVVRSEHTSNGYFYVVMYENEAYSVKQDNVQIVSLSKASMIDNYGYEKKTIEPPKVKVKEPSSFGDVFVATQVIPTNEDFLRRIMGERTIKASWPPFNRQGGGRLPDGAEKINAPAYGVRISNAVMELMSIDGMEQLSAALQVGVPAFQLNKVVQNKIKDAISFFKRDVENLLSKDWSTMNAEGFSKLEALASEIEALNPDSDCMQNTAAWYSFVDKFVSKEWQNNLHINNVLLNFGFGEDSVDELFTRLADITSEDESNLKKNITRSLGWFSKALSCYGMVGSLSDVVNLAFAMTRVPTPPLRLISEDEIVSVLSKLKTELETLSCDSSLWIPATFVHDCEMDDMLAWLILAYAHRKRGTDLEVYVQLPVGKPDEKRFFDVYERRLVNHGAQVYRDPDARNNDPILEYFEAKLSPDYYFKLVMAPRSSIVSTVSIRTLDYGKEITEAFVSEYFLRDPDVPSGFRIEMIEYDQSHTLLHTISGFCSLLKKRLADSNFQPKEVKAGEFAVDHANKKMLRSKLDLRDFTSKFSLREEEEQALGDCRVVLAWHGCKSQIVKSIQKFGFAAFGDLDAGYFGHGNYVSLESTYAANYAEGRYDPGKKKEYPNSEGECAVLLVACLVGFTYPVTPCKEDFKKGVSDSTNPKSCKWYGAPLKSRYHSHLTAVNTETNCTCVQPEAEPKPRQFHELVLKESAQLLPLAVIWFKQR